MAKELTIEEITKFINRIATWEYDSHEVYHGRLNEFSARVSPEQIKISAEGLDIGSIVTPSIITPLYSIVEKKYRADEEAKHDSLRDSLRQKIAEV